MAGGRLISALFLSGRPVVRVLVAGLCISVAAGLSLWYGGREGKRINSLLDAMELEGALVGKFWRVSDIQGDMVRLTKFERSVVLPVTGLPKGIGRGAQVSFVARREGSAAGNAGGWSVTRARLHLAGGLKFWVSAPALALVGGLFFRQFHFDRRVGGFRRRK